MKTAIKSMQSGTVATIYDGSPRQSSFGGPWGSPLEFTHVEIPDAPSPDYSFDGTNWVVDLNVVKQRVVLELRAYVSVTKQRLLLSQNLSDEGVVTDSGNEANVALVDPNFGTLTAPQQQYPLVSAWALGRVPPLTFQQAAQGLSTAYTVWRTAIASIQAALLQGLEVVQSASDYATIVGAEAATKQAMDSITVS